MPAGGNRPNRRADTVSGLRAIGHDHSPDLMADQTAAFDSLVTGDLVWIGRQVPASRRISKAGISRRMSEGSPSLRWRHWKRDRSVEGNLAPSRFTQSRCRDDLI